MRRCLSCFLILLAATAALGDWPEPEQPRKFGPPIRGVTGWAAEEDEETSASPLNEFRAKLKKLQEERDGLKEDRKSVYRWMDAEDANASDLSRLRNRLTGLLTQMASGRSSPTRPASSHEITSESKKTPEAKSSNTLPSAPAIEVKLPNELPSFSASVRPPDPLALGMALFRAGNHADALRAFNMITMDAWKTEDRMPVKYLMATCHRKLEKFDQATKLYLEVANYMADPKLASCAQWQLGTMKWHQETRRQLQSIRERRQTLESVP